MLRLMQLSQFDYHIIKEEKHVFGSKFLVNLLFHLGLKHLDEVYCTFHSSCLLDR